MQASGLTVSRTLSAVIRMPFGPFGIVCAANRIDELVFLPPETPLQAPDSALAEDAAKALCAWLDDPMRPMTFSLASHGTDFQRRVWGLISNIPRGQTRSYGILARTLGSAPRAVGAACGANPFPLVVPCHRVVAANGPGGFAGDTGGYLLEIKRWLLAHEAAP